MHFNPSIRQLSRRVAALAAALWCCVMPVLHAGTPAAEYTACGMLDKHIALAPSHGMYYNREQQLWRWQRATMWTTVEDVYTTEYVKQIATMIENAGGTVYQPRPRLNGQDYVIRNGQGVFVPCGGAYEKGRSGLPRWAECAREWLEHAGYPDSIYDVYQGQNDYRADMMSRGRWVNYLRYDLGVPIDAFLALHTDGISDKANEAVIGSLAIYYTTGENGKKVFPTGESRNVNREIALMVQKQIDDDIRAKYGERWVSRGMRDANYAEARVPDVPTVLIELLSHKNMPDMRLGLDPKFRFDAARAVYKGLLRFVHSRDGEEVVVQPLPVKDCAVERQGADSVALRWHGVEDPLEETASPTYYIVYTRENEGEWHPHRVADTTVYIHQAVRGCRYDYYVVAGNDGGVSYPSETLSAYLAPLDNGHEPPMVMIVNGFNHTGAPEWFAGGQYAGIVPGTYGVEEGLSCAYIGDQMIYDRGLDWTDDDNCGFGMCYRDFQGLTMGNTHDYPTLHGRLLAQMGCSYMSANATAIEELSTAYWATDIILGKHKSGHGGSVISRGLQQALTQYLRLGGTVLVSGSYIGSGMTSKSDKRWAEQQLHFRLRAPKATTRGTMTPTHRLLGDRPITLWQKPHPDHLFAEAPESLEACKGGERLGLYDDMRISFGVASRNSIVYGFPIECSPDFERLYKASVTYLIEQQRTNK